MNKPHLERTKIETTLLEEHTVKDCVVLACDTQTGIQRVAYVVSTGPFVRLQSHLQTKLPAETLPSTFVPISTLPLTADGQLDESALARLQINDTDLVQHWEERIQLLPEINQVAVVVQEKTEALPPLHLSSLLPDWKTTLRAIETPAVDDESVAIFRAKSNDSTPKTLAISHGSPLQEISNAPTTLPAILQRAAREIRGENIIYLQLDGSEVVQSYASLLEEAERIFAGLRKQSLKPQDKVIFQLELNQDIIPAFWGCLLGGFIPVIAVVPTNYSESSRALEQLTHVWQLLEHPLIVTSAELEKSMQTLSQTHPLKNARLCLIETLINNKPNNNYHQAQPDEVAFFNLTSGSTGVPKCIRLTHHNILSRARGTNQLCQHSKTDVILNWLPFDHIGSISDWHLRCVELGCKLVYAPKEYVLRMPINWLELIDKYRITHSWAPNFAYSLINEAIKQIYDKKWDLSCVKSLLTAGESISIKIVKEFLENLAPYKLSQTAIHTAFGMAEMGSGITYFQPTNTTPLKFFSVDRTALEGPLVQLNPEDPNSIIFMSLGPVIPGVSIRIVDDENNLVPEETIGHLHVKGAAVSPGYYKNPEANQAAFLADGWFDTGDLGFISKSQLVLTGRAKESIIINGANFYNSEIESVVEEIEEVEVSYTAACAVRPLVRVTEQLAIFFHTPISDDTRLLELIKKIQAQVTRKIGVKPDYLIPVEKQAIPKTAIGKIQRSQLTQRFEAGEFDPILKQLDILSGNDNTLPNWFYRTIWRRHEIVTLRPASQTLNTLIFLDSLGLGASLNEKIFPMAVTVEIGADFAKLSTNRYRIAPNQPAHYQQLLKSLAQDNFQIDEILHLWTYDEYAGEVSSLETFEQAQVLGVYSVLYLLQALTKVQGTVRLLTISSHTQMIIASDEMAYEKTPLLGIIKTISQEMPWLSVRHIDLPVDSAEVNAALILRERQIISGEQEIAYRQGQRWVQRLESVKFTPGKTLPFKKGGHYLINGGLEGIGVEIAKYLLQHFEARLLLTGKTPLPDESQWKIHLVQADAIAEKIRAYQTLRQAGGEIIYQALDISDFEQLKQRVEQTSSHWQAPLDGVIHLTGIPQKRLLTEETYESLSATFRAEIFGVWTLHQLIKAQPNAIFINFASVYDFFGAATVGAITAASRFQDSLTRYQQQKTALQPYCFHWTLWEDTAAKFPAQVSRALGYYTITANQGLHSFLAGLEHNHLLIGLDGNHSHIRRFIETTAIEVQKLTAYFTATTNDISKLQKLVVQDRFQTPTTCHFVQLQEMPLTETGAIDRKRLAHEHGKVREQAAPTTKIEHQIAKIWQNVLGLPKVGLHDNFFELGGHSLLLVQAQNQLQTQFGVQLSIVEMFKYPSIETLAKYLSQSQTEPLAAQQSYERAQIRKASTGKSDIAVIGMSGRFPGADNIDEFWQNIKESIESITFFTNDEIAASGIEPALLNNPNYVKASPILSDVESFDAEFFGYSAREAEWMDPQQRLLLESAWESMEDAGYNPLTYDGMIGMYAGATMNTYLLNNIYPNRHKLDSNDNLAITTLDSMGGFQMMVANDKDYLTTRVSYKLNLRGPSVNVQTACSTSLMAIHIAAQSLQTGECDIALAGGVSVQVPQKVGYLYQEGMIVSPDGHCRAFDAQAEGTIFGSGVGVVVLKRLEEAQTDGDHIYAVIKGSASNNDGGTKVGYMAPSGDGQAVVASEAIAMAGVEADTITYVEAHGTGTVMGDPIEVNGLTQAFRVTTDKKNFCAIGSVKTNVGHLQITSGVVGFIKTVLSLYHKQIPPSLHFEQANPVIDFANSPFYVNTKLIDWKTNGTPRRAGVNSLGIGGANVHVILEEASQAILENNESERPKHLLTLSAKNEAALQDLVQRYDTFLSTHPQTSLADLCFTANTGRVHFEHRLAIVAESSQQLRTRLIDDEHRAGQSLQRFQNIAFLFTGQGAQYVGMGRQLYETQPTFRKTLDRCDEILRDYLDISLLEVLYPTLDLHSQPEVGNEKRYLDETAYTQPALFALEYALAELWQSWGIKPAYVMGHSVGEYVAACVAGVFSLEEGLKLIAERARLMQALPPDGKMVTVFANETRVATAIQPYTQQVSIAAINGPENLVISGQRDAINAIITTLEADGIKTKALNVSHAFHSPLIESMLPAFERIAKEVTFSPPQINLISNLTGELATADITTPAYWCRHIRQPVKFAASMETLYQQSCDVFVEIGPKPTLLGMGHQCLPENVAVWLPSLRQGKNDWQPLLQSLGELYVRGATIDWSGFDHDYQRRRVRLPTYPFQRKRYWLDRPAAPLELTAQRDTKLHPLLDKKIQLPLFKETVFETYFHIDSLPFLADHLIYDKMVASGASYISMLLGAAELTFGTKAYMLEEILFEHALIIPTKGCTVQLVITPEKKGKASFKLISFGKNTDDCITHVSGKIQTGQIKELEQNNLLIDCHPDNRRDLKVSKDPSYCRDDKPGNYFVPSPKEDKDSTSKSEEFQELWNHCPQAMTAAEFYQIQQNRHIHLGPSYQWLDTIRLGNQEAVCQISMPPSVKDADNYQLHPGLIDAGFGLLASAVDMEVEETFVPFSIEKIGFYQHPSHFPLWGHLRMRPASDKNRAVGDIRLFDQSGQIIVDFMGFEGIKAARKALLSGLQTEFNDWFYEIAWQPQPSPPLHPETTGHWLIFADQSGIGLALAERLQKRGSFCTVVYSGKSYEKEAEGRYHVNPAEPLDFQRLFKENFFDNQLRGIVHLWSLDGTVADLHHAQRLGCASIMHLVQTLVKKSWDQFPRLWLVTRGGQAVPLQVQQTPVWGQGRVIALEHPELDSVCLDLDPSSEDNTQTLFNELWSSDKEAQIVWRQNIRQVARWEPRTLPPSESPFSIREDSSYLISGGTGALGLQIAQWLVEQGARHLLLLSRSGVSSSAAQKIIDQIEQTGAKVLIIKVDVADQAALNQALDRAPMPRGIIHAAGVLDDGMLMGQNWDRFENVMAAKVYGAWNLHQRTANMELDFFVMFSSAASILGNQGQTNYAAANAFLDGLAHYRRNHGLVATSINWGPFAQTGMAASTSSDRLSKQGFKPILPEDGLAVMDRILSANVTQVGAMQCDWHQYVAQFSEKNALFANWVQVPSQATNLLQKINNAPLAEKKKILLDFVLEIIRNVIGIDASQALDTPLMEQGIDSLQAVEMRNRLGKGLETTLPVSLLFNYPTINELINYLEQEVLDEPVEKAQDNDKLDDLNDRELEDLINQKLASKFLK
jgi:acyl transferase domain-containing protein/acyl-CoA synthetase (AMP-forming)/AMP-acid ligase II/NAD(P)-dependent dehydrogenase (short-subunit alcohol dehydrogenase family)/acyl carrier protein